MVVIQQIVLISKVLLRSEKLQATFVWHNKQIRPYLGRPHRGNYDMTSRTSLTNLIIHTVMAVLYRKFIMHTTAYI